MTATGPAIMEVDPGSVAGTAVDRFLDEPLARGLNGETAVDRFLDEPSDWGPAGETAVDRSLSTATLTSAHQTVGGDVPTENLERHASQERTTSTGEQNAPVRAPVQARVVGVVPHVDVVGEC